jgi:GNAT superfamily N-acetyltransferase
MRPISSPGPPLTRPKHRLLSANPRSAELLLGTLGIGHPDCVNNGMPRGDSAAGVALRTRLSSDLDACEQLARRVHARDGYPPYMPNDDFVSFLASPKAISAWVAIYRGELVGHIALTGNSSNEVMDLAAKSTGLRVERLAVIARLFVSPDTRRNGIGRLLLEQAVGEATTSGLVSILDVATTLEAAIKLYEDSGWRRLGRVAVHLPGGARIEEFVYVAPLDAPA